MLRNTSILLIAALCCLFSLTSGIMPGGRFELDIEDPDIKEKLDKLTEFGLAEIANTRMEEKRNMTSTEEMPDSADANEVSSEEKPLKYSLVKIVSAKSQIVSGVNYFITLRMKEADCESSCKSELCELSIYVVPWLNKTELSDFTCKTSIERRLLGGRVAISPQDENAKQAIGFTIDEYNRRSNSLHFYRLVRLNNVQRQIVRGISYSLDFTMGRTSCRKNEMRLLDYEKCPVDEEKANDKHVQSCTATVIDTPWNDNGPRYSMFRQVKCDAVKN